MDQLHPDYFQQPVIGLMPEWHWMEKNVFPIEEIYLKRLSEIKLAIQRYKDADIPVPFAWEKEACKIKNRLGNA